MNRFEYNNKIDIYGSEKNIKIMSELLDTIKEELTGDEATDRLLIQKVLRHSTADVDVLYDGNTVVNDVKIIKAMKRFLKADNFASFSNLLYDFFSTTLGGDIAHYNKRGYYDYYGSAREIFEQRIMDKYVFANIPGWKTDMYELVKELQRLRKTEWRHYFE